MTKETIAPVTEEEWSQVDEFNRNMVEEFLQESMQLSPHTLKQYESGLKIYFRYIKDYCSNKKNVDIKGRDYLKYQNYLTRLGLSSNAVKFKRACVSSLNGYILTYYSDEYPMFHNYITKAIANPPKALVREKIPLTKEEMNLLLTELEKKEDWEKIAYIKFSYAAGCRRAEVRQLLKEVADYKPVEKEKIEKDENGESHIRTIRYYQTHDIRCKGRSAIGKVRKLQFDQEAMDAIKKWLEVRGQDDCPYVFVVKKANGEYKQVGENTFNDWCINTFSKIVGRRVHPHLFRETRATDLVVGEGKDIKSAQRLLGHESSETTEIYVIREGDEDLDDCF